MILISGSYCPTVENTEGHGGKFKFYFFVSGWFNNRLKIILRFYENQFVTSVQRNSELERRKLVEVSNTQGKKNMSIVLWVQVTLVLQKWIMLLLLNILCKLKDKLQFKHLKNIIKYSEMQFCILNDDHTVYIFSHLEILNISHPLKP